MGKFEVDLEKRQELGNYIAKIRKEKKLSLAQLADLTKIGVADLHKIEKGTKQKINPFQLKEIASILIVDYKIFYKICGFLDEKDFHNDSLINSKAISKEDLIKMLNGYYPKINVKTFFNSIIDLKKSQIKEILLFIEFIKNREEVQKEKGD